MVYIDYLLNKISFFKLLYNNKIIYYKIYFIDLFIINS